MIDPALHISLADLDTSRLEAVDEAVIAPAPSVLPGQGALTATEAGPRHFAVVPTDDRSIMALIELILDRAGVSQAEVARRLGIRHQSLNQYRWLRRKRPSIQWISRLAQACGARIVIEFPTKERRF